MRRGIEVFQGLVLTAGGEGLPAIRASLIKHQTTDWVHDAAREAELREYSERDEDSIRFGYGGTKLPQARLFLWTQAGGYTVTNIVPTNKRELNVTEYNSLLQNFVHEVVHPAQSEADFEVELTDPVCGLENWVSKETAEALQQFSAQANKSTTNSYNSYPNDAKLWEQFVIGVHLEGSRLSTDILMQWLSEIDRWTDLSAQKLAIDYENGLSILETYDRLTKDKGHDLPVAG